MIALRSALTPRIGGRILLQGSALFLLALLSAQDSSAGYFNSIYTVRTESNIVYYASGGTNCLLDAYLPVESTVTDKPAIIFLHGNSGNKNDLGSLARTMAKQGFACFSATWWYPNIGLDASVMNVVRWVRANAATYGIAPDRIAAFGVSYGGSQAITLGSANFVDSDARVQAVIANPGWVFYPQNCDENDAPIMSVNFTGDALMSIEHAREDIVTLKDANVSYGWFPVEGGGHGVPLERTVAFGKTMQQITTEFLVNHFLGDEQSSMALFYGKHRGSGSITLSPDNAFYPKGTTVSLSATAAPGSTFLYWEGDASGATPTATLTMDSNKNVTAVFADATDILYTLDTNVLNSGHIELSPPGGRYLPGTVVTVTAIPHIPFEGWDFENWDGALSGTDIQQQITMTGDASVTAVFGDSGEPLPALDHAGLALLLTAIAGAATRQRARRRFKRP